MEQHEEGQVPLRNDKNLADVIESKLESRRTMALYRIELLEQEDASLDGDDGDTVGLPAQFVKLLEEKAVPFFHSLENRDESLNRATTASLADLATTKDMLFVLSLYGRIAKLDVTLNDEVAMEGGHVLLSRLMKLDVTSISHTESEQDAIMEVQEMACEIAALSQCFPRRLTPLTRDELEQRLPLVFRFRLKTSECIQRYGYQNPKQQNETCEELVVLVNQVNARQSAQKDVGFVMWPSAVVLSRWLISNQALFRGKTVLELGAGCGLVGLVAASLKAKTTILSDFNETVVSNLVGNLKLNGLEGVAKSLDFYEQEANRKGWVTTSGEVMEPVDVILASDVICQPDDAFAVAQSIACALKTGGKCVVVSADSKHRFGVEKFEGACKLVGLDVSTQNVIDMIHDNQSLAFNSRIGGIEKTSGFVPSMKMTMYMICKPEIQ